MTIFYTLIRENKSKKIISGGFSPQAETTVLGKDILKEVRDIEVDQDISKIESSLDSNFLYLIYRNRDILYSVIIDKYEKDQNAINYLQELDSILNSKNFKVYEFDNVIKEKSNEYNKDKTLREIDATKDMLADSLQLIIQRRENLGNISKLADRLTFETKEMQDSIKKMQFKNLAREYGIYGLIFLIFVLFLYYILH